MYLSLPITVDTFNMQLFLHGKKTLLSTKPYKT